MTSEQAEKLSSLVIRYATLRDEMYHAVKVDDPKRLDRAVLKFREARGTLMSKKSKAADDFSERMLAIHAREVEALERIADRIAGIAHILAAAPILGREPTVKTK